MHVWPPRAALLQTARTLLATHLPLPGMLVPSAARVGVPPALDYCCSSQCLRPAYCCSGALGCTLFAWACCRSGPCWPSAACVAGGSAISSDWLPVSSPHLGKSRPAPAQGRRSTVASLPHGPPCNSPLATCMSDGPLPRLPVAALCFCLPLFCGLPGDRYCCGESNTHGSGVPSVPPRRGLVYHTACLPVSGL